MSANLLVRPKRKAQSRAGIGVIPNIPIYQTRRKTSRVDYSKRSSMGIPKCMPKHICLHLKCVTLQVGFFGNKNLAACIHMLVIQIQIITNKTHFNSQETALLKLQFELLIQCIHIFLSIGYSLMNEQV